MAELLQTMIVDCQNPDEIVASVVGAKGWHEGKQYGLTVLVSDDVRESSYLVHEVMQVLTDEIASCLGVAPEHRDADWRARFTIIVQPMTQFDLDRYLAMTEDQPEDDDGS